MLEFLEEPKTTMTIAKSDRIGSHIQKVTLTFAPEVSLAFAIGSYIQPMIASKVPRAYSIVEADGTSCTIIVSFSGQGVGARFFENAPVGTTIDVYGPYDDFPYHEGTGRSKVFLATGTGVAPFIGMVQAAIAEGQESLLVLGVPGEEDLPYRTFFESLQQSNKSFFFLPTLSKPGPTWKGATGYVTQQFATAEDRATLCRSDVYVCGVPMMIESTKKILKQFGVPKSQIYIQKFG